MSADGPIGDAALRAMMAVHDVLGGDPRLTYVAMMTGAAVAGHMINRSPEEMHATLDQVKDVAEELMLRATETRQ